MNFKKLTPEEITERISRIGGTGWVTAEDYKRFSRQSMLILEHLASFPRMTYPRAQLEAVSGSKRVASRIDELRDEWEIETVRIRKGVAAYKLIGRRWEKRTKKAHCSTCFCNKLEAQEPPPNQTRMPL